MSRITSHLSISLDGFIAGVDQSVDNPIGIRGERLFDGVDDPGLEPIEVVHSPRATHVRYRVGRTGG
jgi:hypothetical protein